MGRVGTSDGPCRGGGCKPGTGGRSGPPHPPSPPAGGLRSDWEAWHGPDDGGWRSEDCSVWLAAVLLHDMGLEPSVVYAEAGPEAMF